MTKIYLVYRKADDDYGNEICDLSSHEVFSTRRLAEDSIKMKKNPELYDIDELEVDKT